MPKPQRFITWRDVLMWALVFAAATCAIDSMRSAKADRIRREARP